MEEIREHWTSRPTFIIAAIGSAVGLGNLWRFPYVAAQNGGGAFLIPYLIAILTTGIPLMILEYGLGQSMQSAAPKAFGRLGRKFEWVGWFALMVSSVICIYYAAVMAWCWRYLWASLTLEWGPTHESIGQFFGKVIAPSGKPEDVFAGINWSVLIGLAITWAVIYWIICRGVGRVGKVVMVTVPLPLLLIIVLIVRGLTLHGANVGLNYYLAPSWEYLLKGQTWLAAYGQVFFSLSLGFGIMVAYASYMPKNQDVSNSAFLTTFANCATSYLAGFAVFSVLGYLAVSTNQDIVKAAGNGGPGLVFVVYPEAINSLPAALGPYTKTIFGIVFFVMLLSLGIDSAFSLVEAVVAGIRDKWPHINRARVTATVCAISFLLGLVFITNAGLVWLDIVDHWCNNYGLVTVGLLECVIIGWLIKPDPLMDSINESAEIRVGTWWLVCIKFITPIVLCTLLALNVRKEFMEQYGNYEFWALLVGGWLMLLGAAVAAFLLTNATREEAVQ